MYLIILTLHKLNTMKKLIYILLITFSTISYSQTPINQGNFLNAISDCLSTNPVDGLCSDSEFGSMPDWDVSNVTDMTLAFAMPQWGGAVETNNFNADISSWDVSNVTNMDQIFRGASDFNQPLNNWDVSNVTIMNRMFELTSFNQPLNNWDVSSVTMMDALFSDTPFNQNINSWNVSNVTLMGSMFTNTPFNQPLNNWDVSNVWNMVGMFYGCASFDQDISNWDTSNVTIMANMFINADSFNQDISSWNVSNVTSMGSMFRFADNMNQDLSNWDVDNVVNCFQFCEGTDWILSKPNFYDCGPLGGDGYPEITIPSELNVSTNNGCTATNVSLGYPTTTNNCSFFSITNNAPSSFNIGETIVTWTVLNEDNGLSSSAYQTVLVADNTSPTVICNELSLTLVNGIASVSANDIDNGSFDNCGDVTLEINQSYFSESHIGDNTVILTATDQYGNSSSCETNVIVQAGMSLVENSLSSISLFPNPSSDLVYIKGHNDINLKVSVFDISGKKILELEEKNSFDISLFKIGVYFVNISDGIKTVIQKIIKK